MTPPRRDFDAVFFDFGGVLTTSPFQAFARYEARAGLPDGFVRGLNASDPDTNAWSRLERSEIGVEEFCRLYEAEAAAAGATLDASEVLACLHGAIVPEMVEAVRRLRDAGFRTALLTNNWIPASAGPPGYSPASLEYPGGSAAARVDTNRGGAATPPDPPASLELFDVVIESSREGVRKPEPRFYEIACERLGVAPERAVFLDDLGVNLKPAAAMGMATIKVVDHDSALEALEALTGVALR